MIRRLLLPAAAALAIILGALLGVVFGAEIAREVWMIALLGTGAPVVFRTLISAVRGRFATDAVATLSIIGSVALSQPLAGLVIVLMQTGGEALERFAEGRASAAVRALEEAAPRIAHRVVDERIEEVAVSAVALGDVLLVRPGELVPCDGIVLDGESELDTSSLTGEAMPVRAVPGLTVMSGMVNGFGVFQMKATAAASGSQYARIVDLVRSAQASKAPIQRMADRYAVWFTPIVIAVCIVVVLVTHDWLRVLAVLVVATPCPLILAAPVAIVGGINRAARQQIIIRHGDALERLADVDIAVFDKTGTITIGTPRLADVRLASGFDRTEVLRLAAALEQGSSHRLAGVLVAAAESERIELPRATQHQEAPGQGVSGDVEGHAMRVGARSFVVPFCETGVRDADRLEGTDATLRAYVSIDGRLAAVLEYADELRPELPTVLADLERQGVRRFVLLSGDHAPIARAIAARAGVSEVYGDLLPADKAQFIERLRSEGTAVMMVGDGVNDAPALTSADVGIALAGHGGGITTEAADVIILVDSLSRVPQAVTIGTRTLRIARQSINVGLGLSGVFMLVAAFGGIAPAIGAALQEVIDVAVIFNALRSAREPKDQRRPPPGSSLTRQRHTGSAERRQPEPRDSRLKPAALGRRG
jgi:heavy metal translocating P-type ATPase